MSVLSPEEIAAMFCVPGEELQDIGELLSDIGDPKVRKLNDAIRSLKKEKFSDDYVDGWNDAIEAVINKLNNLSGGGKR